MELFITRTWPEKNRLNVFSNSAIFGDFDQLPKSFQLLQAFKCNYLYIIVHQLSITSKTIDIKLISFKAFNCK